MHLEIVSPEATLFSGEVESVALPGSLGDFQVLNHHAPIVSTLTEGTVKIKGNLSLAEAAKEQFVKEDATTTLFKIRSGTVEMLDNKMVLLAD